MTDELDMQAVQQDAELLDALAARQPIAQPDKAARLLAALVVDVDTFPVPLAEAIAAAPAADAMPVLFPFGAEVTEVNGVPVLPPPDARPGRHRQRHVSRAVVGGTVAGAVLLAGGVAAAVSGDPLAPIRKVIDVVAGTEAPDKVPAEVDRGLDEARDDLSRGDAASAEDKIAELRDKLAGLEGPEAEALRAQLAILQMWLTEQLTAETDAGEPEPATSEEPVEPEPEPEPAPEPKPEPEPEPTIEPTTEPGPTTEPTPSVEPEPTGTDQGSTQSGPGTEARSNAPGQKARDDHAGEQGKAARHGKASEHSKASEQGAEAEGEPAVGLFDGLGDALEP